MDVKRWALLGTVFSTATLVAVASCSGDSSTSVLPSTSSATGMGGNSTTTGSMSTTATGFGGNLFDAGGQECANDNDCNGGVCNNGTCCGSAALVCDDTCCNQGEVCLFGGCVTPGDPCVSQADCPKDHYCEPALGDNGQGGSGQGGDCTQPLEYGKCVPLPPLCSEVDGGADAGNCIEKCEYYPRPAT